MAQVNFPADIGGNGQTYSDDANPNTGLANGGHRVRFIPLVAQVVAVALWIKTNSALVISARDAAIGANTDAAAAANVATSAAQTAANAATAAATSATAASTSRNEALQYRNEAAAVVGFDPVTRTITGTGLLGGQGGNLTANRVFNLPEATDAEAISGQGTGIITGRQLGKSLTANSRTLSEDLGLQWFFD